MVKNKHLLDKVTPELAYWLGYISADGSIKKDMTKLSFCIKSDDIELLEGIKEYFDITNTISTRQVYDNRTQKTYSSASLQICDVEFVRKLEKYNLTTSKSKNFDIPDILLNSEYFISFLHGLIDGDGHITASSNSNRISVGIMSTLKAITKIKTVLKKQYGIKSSKIDIRYSSKQFDVARITFDQDALKLLTLIYSSKKGLIRKYKKYLEAVEINGMKCINPGATLKRRVSIYSKSGELWGNFDSLKEAAKFLKIDASTLSNIISGQNSFNRDYVVVAKNYLKQKKLRNGKLEITEYTKKNSKSKQKSRV